jgi:hypothetical protein
VLPGASWPSIVNATVSIGTDTDDGTTTSASARAYIAILPAGVGGITAADGMTSFQFAAGRKAVLRAWHPSLGVAVTTFDPDALAANSVVTLTYRR